MLPLWDYYFRRIFMFMLIVLIFLFLYYKNSTFLLKQSLQNRNTSLSPQNHVYIGSIPYS